MAYDPKITAKKSRAGAVDGAIVGVVALVVIGFIKTKITTLTPEQENMVAGAVGVIVSTAVLAAKRGIANWMKYKEPKTASEEPPAPAEKAE